MVKLPRIAYSNSFIKFFIQLSMAKLPKSIPTALATPSERIDVRIFCCHILQKKRCLRALINFSRFSPKLLVLTFKPYSVPLTPAVLVFTCYEFGANLHIRTPCIIAYFDRGEVFYCV